MSLGVFFVLITLLAFQDTYLVTVPWNPYWPEFPYYIIIRLWHIFLALERGIVP